MKIYNKRNFNSSLLSCSLGLALLTTSLIKGFHLKSIFLIIACLFLGISGIIRSTSKTSAKEDLIEEQDERNQLIKLKATSKTLVITQRIAFATGLFFTIFGTIKEQMPIVGFGVGIILIYTLSLFVEIVAYLYYEKHE